MGIGGLRLLAAAAVEERKDRTGRTSAEECR